jgi:hypothetical protein
MCHTLNTYGFVNLLGFKFTLKIFKTTSDSAFILAKLAPLSFRDGDFSPILWA